MSETLMIILFSCYVLLTTFMMYRAVKEKDPRRRLKNALALLTIVSIGVPLLVAFILLFM